MQTRKLGRTNLDVSVIGLGPEHLVGKPYSQVFLSSEKPASQSK